MKTLVVAGVVAAAAIALALLAHVHTAYVK
jgi:hypothetical protein